MIKKALIALALVFLIIACKKTNTPHSTPLGGNSNYLKNATIVRRDSTNLTNTTDSMIYSFHYDAENRPSQVTYLEYYNRPPYTLQSPIGADTDTYVYANSTIFMTTKLLDSFPTLYPTYNITFLNPGTQLADSSIDINLITILGTTFQDTTRIYYTYDTNNYLLSVRSYDIKNGLRDAGSIVNYTIREGNTVGMDLTDSVNALGPTVQIDSFTFSSKPNVTPYIGSAGYYEFSFFGYGFSFTGHPNTNLVASYNIAYYNGMYYNNPQFYDYTYDSLGRVNEMIIKTALGQVIQSDRFTYY